MCDSHSRNQPHTYFTRSLLRTLDALQRFRFAPILVPSETYLFAHHMARGNGASQKQLDEWATRLPSDALEDEILRIAVPVSLQSLVQATRRDDERLSMDKEQAIAMGNFERAAACRDEQQARIRATSALFSESIRIEPVHVEEAMRRLGFDSELGSSG